MSSLGESTRVTPLSRPLRSWAFPCVGHAQKWSDGWTIRQPYLIETTNVLGEIETCI